MTSTNQHNIGQIHECRVLSVDSLPTLLFSMKRYFPFAFNLVFLNRSQLWNRSWDRPWYAVWIINGILRSVLEFRVIYKSGLNNHLQFYLIKFFKLHVNPAYDRVRRQSVLIKHLPIPTFLRILNISFPHVRNRTHNSSACSCVTTSSNG